MITQEWRVARSGDLNELWSMRQGFERAGWTPGEIYQHQGVIVQPLIRWANRRPRADMAEAVHGDTDPAYLSGAHGEFGCVGQAHAELALFEAMSAVSEERDCAAWLSGNGEIIWSWLQTGEMHMGSVLDLEDLADDKARIIALANASQVWWPDFDFAVPLADWVARHGAAPGVVAR